MRKYDSTLLITLVTLVIVLLLHQEVEVRLRRKLTSSWLLLADEPLGNLSSYHRGRP